MKARSSGLSPETILASALHLARDRDLRGLTLKAIADDLGVTPMALYRYFPTKAALMSGVLDALVIQVAVTGHGLDPGDPRAWLRATFTATRRALVERPGALALLADGHHFGAATLAVVDQVLGVLRSANLDARDAVRSCSALIAYTLGSAALEIAARASTERLDGDPEERARQLEAGLSSLSRNQHRHVVECAPYLAHNAVRYPFEAGLERLLAGLDA
jgi:TetR/AcrR family tetracycline transcriptional repressor